MAESTTYPKLRPVEAFPIEDGGRRLMVLHDPSAYATGPITVSPAAMYILIKLDGTNGPEEIQRVFAEQFGQELPREQLDDFITQLDEAHYLETDAFTSHVRSLVEEYRAAPTRPCRDLAGYGIDLGGSMQDQALQLQTLIRQTLLHGNHTASDHEGRRLAGLIAPHLDYDRGAPCYADAYNMLAKAGPVRRVVILGTNHYGESTSVVATRKDFATPLGITRTDRAFLDALEAGCGVDLCVHEFDHAREHSVELQVLLLQQILGAGQFDLVAALCPDPCGPTGTAPRDGEGVDLRVFAETLGKLIRSDRTPMLILAGADLSHVGYRFGDDCELESAFLADVEGKDRDAVAEAIAGRQQAFVQKLTARDNSTRVCSAGCIYALRTALAGAEGELLRYHQAVDIPSGTCVTCCAAAFWE